MGVYKMMKQIYLLLIFALLLTSCRTISNERYEASVVPRLPWPESEYSQITKNGDAIVTGQGFMRTRGGDVKVAAGSKVVLSPVTSYSKQFVDIMIRKTNSYSVLDPELPDIRIYEYIKETIADAEGKFKFINVADGNYYVYTYVFWESPTSHGLEKQGGWVWQEVKVFSNKENHFILTR